MEHNAERDFEGQYVAALDQVVAGLPVETDAADVEAIANLKKTVPELAEMLPALIADHASDDPHALFVLNVIERWARLFKRPGFDDLSADSQILLLAISLHADEAGVWEATDEEATYAMVEARVMIRTIAQMDATADSL